MQVTPGLKNDYVQRYDVRDEQEHDFIVVANIRKDASEPTVVHCLTCASYKCVHADSVALATSAPARCAVT